MPRPGSLHFATLVRRFGRITAIVLTVSALRATGGLRGPGTRHIGFVLSGAVTLTPPDGPPVTLHPGDACSVGDLTDVDVETAEGTRILHLIASERRLLARGVRQPAGLVVLDATRSLRGPLRNFVLSVADPSWRPSEVGALVAEQTIEDLLVGMLLEHQSAVDRAREREALMARALADVARHSNRPSLTPARLAEHLGVSLRHLQRSFEGSGMTVAHAIALARLRTASLLLSSPTAIRMTMAEVASRAGFRSTFELRSAFRGEFGVLPSQYRAEHAAKVVPEHA